MPRQPASPRRRSLGLTSSALLLVASRGALAQPPIVNPGFELIGPVGSPASSAARIGRGPIPSAAEGWQIHHTRHPASTKTELLPSTAPEGGAHMLHVRTSTAGAGIRQAIDESHEPARPALVSAWVFVVRGRVVLGIDDAEARRVHATTRGTGRWELLQIRSQNTTARSVILHASEDDAEFFVDNVGFRALRPPRKPVPAAASDPTVAEPDDGATRVPAPADP